MDIIRSFTFVQNLRLYPINIINRSVSFFRNISTNYYHYHYIINISTTTIIILILILIT